MRQGHGTKLSYYDLGATPFFALGVDPRVSYCLHVPETYNETDDRVYDLIVLMHGTERGAATYRDRFADFADASHCIVLAPLFPCNLAGPGDLDNYKLVEMAGMRFDQLLLAMVDEVAAKYKLRDNSFLLHGFSGGGHFAHRFAYLHPLRLRAVSIGAPGVVTLLDTDRDWWVGVRDLKERFGIALDLAALRALPVQMVVGRDDVQTWEITIPENSFWWRPGLNEAGATRINRLEALCRSFEAAGVSVRFDTVPGVAHDGWAVLDPVKAFFADVLAQGKAA